MKDLIIRGGRNIHPADIEAAVGRLAGLIPGRVAAFGDSGNEARRRAARRHGGDPQARCGRARCVARRDQRGGRGAGRRPPDEAAGAANAILRTSSGKILAGRRAATSGGRAGPATS
ncbi:MAG: hypothetical protein U1E33_05890 [Rhodospirillales bacterium]